MNECDPVCEVGSEIKIGYNQVLYYTTMNMPVVIEGVELFLYSAVQSLPRVPSIQPPPHQTPAILAFLTTKRGR